MQLIHSVMSPGYAEGENGDLGGERKTQTRAQQCELRKEGRNERSGKGSLCRTWYSLLYSDAIKSRIKKKVFKGLQMSVNSEVSNATSTFRVL